MTIPLASSKTRSTKDILLKGTLALAATQEPGDRYK